MSTEKLIPIAAGVACAGLVLSMLSGVAGTVIFVFAAMLPLFLSAFGWGIVAGQIATLVGTVLIFALGGFQLGLLFVSAMAIPSLLVIRQSLLGRKLPNGGIRWYPVGHILCHLAALGAIVTTAAAMVHFDVDGGLRGAVESYLDRGLTTMLAGVSDADRELYIAAFAPNLPGIVGMFWIIIIVINATIAQGLLARSGRNRRPSPAYSSLNIPDWISWTWVAAALLTILTTGALEYLGRNMSIILATPFFFSGLGFIHLLARQFALPGLALVVVYTIVILSGWAMFAVAGLGMIEKWAGLRARFTAGAGPDEEEE